MAGTGVGALSLLSAASPPHGNEHHSDQRGDGIGQHFEDRDPGIGCVVVCPCFRQRALRHARSLTNGRMRALAAREAGCVLDLIAELTRECSFGDSQIVVSVKDAY